MMRFKKILKYSVTTLLIIVLGGTIGFFSGNFIAFKIQKKPNYNFDVEAYTESILDIDFNENETPDLRSASDAFIIATHILNTKDYYKIIGNGIMDTGLGKLGSMKLWGNAEKIDNQIHTSIVAYNKVISKYQVGLRYDYDLLTARIDFYYGKSYSDGSADWDIPENISVDEYINEWGLHPSNFFTYTISSKTAVRNDLPTISYENGEKLYHYSLLLDTRTSVANYATQLKKMSQLNNYPIFSYIQFDFTLNENFDLQNVYINEKYNIYIFGVLVKCEANITYDFIY